MARSNSISPLRTFFSLSGPIDEPWPTNGTGQTIGTLPHWSWWCSCPPTPRWLTEQWWDRHEQSFLWPAQAQDTPSQSPSQIAVFELVPQGRATPQAWQPIVLGPPPLDAVVAPPRCFAAFIKSGEPRHFGNPHPRAIIVEHRHSGNPTHTDRYRQDGPQRLVPSRWENLPRHQKAGVPPKRAHSTLSPPVARRTLASSHFRIFCRSRSR